MFFDSEGNIFGPFGPKPSMPYCPNNERIGYGPMKVFLTLKS